MDLINGVNKWQMFKEAKRKQINKITLELYKSFSFFSVFVFEQDQQQRTSKQTKKPTNKKKLCN